jgi:DNA-binding NarL/FixJ family response regulator
VSAKAVEQIKPGRKRRLLLVDDHPIVREGFAQLINHEPDLEVCGLASNAAKALDDIAALKPDLVIVDISLEGTNGLELMKHLHCANLGVPVLALSMHAEYLYAERALRAGAMGYVMKHSPTEEVLAAIRQVLRGERYLSEKMRARMLDKLSTGAIPQNGSEIECLSDRELEVFQLIGSGRKTRQIAEQLKLSVKTVETYRAHIKEKLKLQDGAELVRYAVEWNQRRL